jgi:hypothetical protein
MYASIFKAAAHTGYKFELVLHSAPGLADSFVKTTTYFNSKVDAKKAAKAANAKAWNY